LKTETTILIFILILNLTVLMIADLGDAGVIPGLSYTKHLNATGTSEQFEERFNATDVIEEWEPPTVTIPIIGDVFGALMFLWKQITFVIAGFPIFLWDLGAVYIETDAGLDVWRIICTTIGLIFSIYMCWFIFQLISGRITNE
jgi:hypothetical protein